MEQSEEDSVSQPAELPTLTRLGIEDSLVLVPLLAGVIAFALSYRRWLNPIIDVGRDLYIPEQLRFGVPLYKDILYNYPPLTPYLLAAITALSGSGLNAYMGIGLATALLTALTIWTIVRPLAGPHATAAALLIFFSYSMAGVGLWGSNYIFPYTYAATFAMLFFLGATAALLRNHPGLALVLLLASSWAKIEFAAYSAAMMLFVVVTRRVRWTWLLAYVVAGLATLAIAIVVFSTNDLLANILSSALLSGRSARIFYSQVTGTDEWQSNLLLASRGAALIGVFVLLLLVWSRWPRTRVLVLGALTLTTWLLANDTFFRAWMILQLAIAPFAIRKPREPLALLLLASLCASSRIFFRIVPVWYGFVHVLPVVVLMAYVFFEWLPARRVYSRKAALFWLPLILIICTSGLLRARHAYADAQPVQTSRGTYSDIDVVRASEVSALLNHLRQVGARELVVMPEGLTLNYLSGLPTPLRHQTFTPVEIAGNERAVVTELAARRPQYVVIVPRNVQEFGYRGFGIDYGVEIVAWLRVHYRFEQRFGSMVLLRAQSREESQQQW